MAIRLACTADADAATLVCEPAAPSAGGPASADVIVGGQNQFVRMASSGVTVSAGVMSANVTVQNLTVQPMGTPDGAAVDPNGVRVFFSQEPTSPVVVANADGTAPFTGSTPQSFFRYGGTALGADSILSPAERSSARQWRFQLNGATKFTFSVLVSTAVPNEHGYSIRLSSLARGGDAHHTCAQAYDGDLYCWGNNWYGQLGLGDTVHRTTPRRVRAGAAVTLSAAVVGSVHTCALGSDGTAYCWGVNDGNLGDGTTTQRHAPVPVSAPAGVSLSGLSAGGRHTCARGSDGMAYCWGRNVYGQLGTGDTLPRLVPAPVAAPAGVTFTAIATGYYHTCARGSDGNAYCWGYNRAGQLGDSTTVKRPTPVVVRAPAGVTLSALAAASDHTCAQGSDGKLYCWGEGNSNQLGDGTGTQRWTPTAVAAPAGVTLTGVTTGFGHSCALGSDGGAYCWGSNAYGQLGNPDASSGASIPVPVSMPPGVSLAGINAGAYHTCVRDVTGPALCWGRNDGGQLGDGTTAGYADRRRPVIVAGTR